MKSPANRCHSCGADDTTQCHCNATADSSQFQTSNPRHLRILIAITRRPMPREHVDTEAGASNGPELIAELRRRGLKLPCARVPCYDRDGKEVKRGIYHATGCDKRKISRFFNQRKSRNAK